MGKTGCALIGFAIFLVLGFALDQAFYRENREAHLKENLNPIQLDEMDPSITDPELYAPSIGDDVSSDRFDLNAEELRLADKGADYEYIVQDGDTIDLLARKYLGRHDLKKLLYEENPELPRGLRLAPGTRIKIPFRYRIP